MLKGVASKLDPNLKIFNNISKMIGKLANYKTLEKALIDLAQKGMLI